VPGQAWLRQGLALDTVAPPSGCRCRLRDANHGGWREEVGIKEREVLSDHRSELEEIAGRLAKIKEYL
jgi:hypothetical protein